MDDFMALGQQVLAAQPFSQFFKTELIAFRIGYAELRIPIQPTLFQQHGSLHGGVLSYAADNALTFAGGSVLGVSVVTAEMSIHYLKAARGDMLLAPCQWVILLLPDSDFTASMQIVRERMAGLAPDDFDFAEHVWKHMPIRDLATHTFYTGQRTPAQLCDEVYEVVNA